MPLAFFVYCFRAFVVVSVCVFFSVFSLALNVVVVRLDSFLAFAPGEEILLSVWPFFCTHKTQCIKFSFALVRFFFFLLLFFCRTHSRSPLAIELEHQAKSAHIVNVQVISSFVCHMKFKRKPKSTTTIKENEEQTDTASATHSHTHRNRERQTKNRIAKKRTMQRANEKETAEEKEEA